MKNIAIIVILIFVLLLGYYTGRIHSIKPIPNISQKENIVQVIPSNTQDLQADKLNLELDSFQSSYKKFQDALPFIDNLANHGDIKELYNYGGADTFMSWAYVCHVIAQEKDVQSLKERFSLIKDILLLSSGSVFGGEVLMNQYNQNINNFINTDKTYTEFYSELQTIGKSIIATGVNLEVEQLANVAFAVYGAGNQKFSQGKTIDCREIFEDKFEYIKLHR